MIGHVNFQSNIHRKTYTYPHSLLVGASSVITDASSKFT